MKRETAHLRLVVSMTSNDGVMQQWGRVIRRELDARDMTNGELAHLIGKSDSTVTRLFSDEELPTMDVLMKVADVLGLTLGDLFLSDEQARILREYSPAAEARRGALLEQARHLLEAAQAPHEPRRVDAPRHSKAR